MRELISFDLYSAIGARFSNTSMFVSVLCCNLLRGDLCRSQFKRTQPVNFSEILKPAFAKMRNAVTTGDDVVIA